jgi:hypothetical protein
VRNADAGQYLANEGSGADIPSVDTSDHQDVTWAEEIERRAQLWPSVVVPLRFSADDIAACTAQSGLLDGDILIGRAGPRIPENSHTPAQLYHLILDHD